MSALGDASRPSKLGRYELISQIGQGGMAEVQLALQRGPAGFEKLVVVKLVHENLASQKPFVDMLLDEARMAALVKHPNVVDIYDLGEDRGRYFIAMEYLEGEPLLAVLRAGRDGTRLDALSTTRLVADTAEGLDAAHELRSMAGDPIELVHHDVSLGNIVILYNGQVKLVDFGVAKAQMSAAKKTAVQGKFSYMAPEKLRGGQGDRRSDIWSLGCVLWEALTLRRLFKGGNERDTMHQVLESIIPRPSTVCSDVPAELDTIVMHALARDPDQRYASAKELATDLEEVLRRRGYSGKNDAIARYMQTTFREHLAARRKLLQEVSSKGRASADVLEAAFSNTTVPGLGTSSLAAEGTPSQDPFPDVFPEPADDLAGRTIVSGPVPARRSPLVWLAGGAVVAGVIVAAVILLTHESTSRPTEAATPLAGIVPDAAELQVAVDAAIVDPVAIDAAPVDAAPREIVMPPDDHVGKGSAIKRPPPPPPVSVDELMRAGLQAYVKGDTKTAMAAYRKARDASPRLATAWRGIGLCAEKLGDKGNAKAAFTKYLALAPNAGDAPQIRARLGKL